MTSSAIVLIDPNRAIQDSRRRRDIVMKMRTENILRPGIDFGKVPGTPKETLLKPGAERLCSAFGFDPVFELLDTSIECWDDKTPMFHYRYRCRMIHIETGLEIANGIGSCNSKESKYRWRWVDVLPEGIDPATVETRGGTIFEFDFAVKKAETTGKYGKPAEYWQKFKDTIEAGTARSVQRETTRGMASGWEISSLQYRIPNDDVFSLVNTIDKMAQKRSLIASTLIAANASEFFTQDVEDLPGFGGDVVEGTYSVLAPNTPIEEAVLVEDPPKSSPKPALETASAANADSVEAQLFVATNEINKQKLADFWVKMGFADKNKQVNWTAALEETRAMLGKSIKGFGEVIGYETPEDFFAAMETFISENAQKQPPAKTKTTKKFEWTDDLVQQSRNWISEHFGLSDEYALLKGTHGTIREFASPEEVRADVIRCALADKWEVESSVVTYDGKGSPINFVTAIGNVRFYSRTELSKMLGEEIYAEVGLDALKDDSKGKFTLNKPVRLEWTVEGEPGHEYMIATSVMTTDEIPF